MKSFLLFSLLTVLVACGKETQRAGVTNHGIEKATGVSETCPFAFAGGARCAEVKWQQGPQGGSKSAFAVRFWEKGKREATLTPAGKITAFLRMRCCGTVTATPLTVAPSGELVASSVKLAPGGEYDLFVQIEVDGKTEKQSVPLNVP